MTTPLRVLMACPPAGNPYVSELVRSLNERPEVVCVQSHEEFLSAGALNYDVVHFQWPEAIFGWNEACTHDRLAQVQSRLLACREQGIKLVGTVHNEAPHVLTDSLFSRLYKCMYESMDAFVHLGETSVVLLENSGQSPDAARHCVIPHGNYGVFRELQSDQAVGLPKRGGFTVLCFGAVRKPAEIGVICRVADCLSAVGGKLIIAGRVFSGSRKKIRYYRMQLPLKVRRNVRVIPGKIPDERVSALVSDCDALLIPRVDTLNSGNVALGFTFGKVVVGPDIGVIGEELRRQGNPVFDPLSFPTVKKAISEAIRLSETELGARNKIYAETELAWGRVAEMHENLYRSTQSSSL